MGLLPGSEGGFFFLSFPLIYIKENWSKILRLGGGANMSILVVAGLDGMFFKKKRKKKSFCGENGFCSAQKGGGYDFNLYVPDVQHVETTA